MVFQEAARKQNSDSSTACMYDVRAFAYRRVFRVIYICSFCVEYEETPAMIMVNNVASEVYQVHYE